MNTSKQRTQPEGVLKMKVFAYYNSAISGNEIEFELTRLGKGFVFQNCETFKPEMGTYTEARNKFEALDKFKHIFGNLGARFELV
jgi:hypothetical protein